MAEAAGALNLGTLTVQLAADVSRLQKEFNKAFKETEKLAAEAHSLRTSFDRAFGGVATAATRVAGNLNQVGESISKVFGEKGLLKAKQFATEMGVMPDQVEAISTALKGLSGAFSAVAIAAGTMTATLAASLAAALGLVAAYGALKGLARESEPKPKQPTPEKPDSEKTWLERHGYVPGGRDLADQFDDSRARFYKTPEGANAELDYVMLSERAKTGALSEAEQDRLNQVTNQLPRSITGLGPNDLAGREWQKDIDLGGAFKKSMEAGLKDFEGITSKIKEMFAPDTSKKDLEESKKLSEEANKAERERQKSLQEAFAEQRNIYDEEVKAREDEAAALKKAMEAEQKAREEAADAIGKAIEAAGASYEQYQRSLDETIGGVGGSRMGGASGPALSSNGGPTMSESELDERTAVDKDVKQGMKGLGQAALQGSGTFGEVLSAFQQSGSLIGGIINAVIKLFEKSEGFKTILAMLGEVAQLLADGLGQVFDGLQPVIGVLGEIVTLVIGILQPILSKVGKILEPLAAILQIVFMALEGLSPLLTFFSEAIGGVLQAVGWILQKIIFPVVQGVLFVVMKIGQALSWVINGIIDALSAVMWEIGAMLQKVGAQDAGTAMKKAADAMHAYEIDTKAINDAADAMWNTSFEQARDDANATLNPLADLADGAGTAAAAVKDFGESLTNLPSGYKIALARYSATTPLTPFADGGIVTRPTAALIGEAGPEAVVPLSKARSGTLQIMINGITDPRAVASEVKKMLRREGYLEQSPVLTGA